MGRLAIPKTLGFGALVGIALVLVWLGSSVSPVRAALGGPVILGGDDLTDHGSRGADIGPGTTLFNGWLYIQKALENLAPNVTRAGNDGSVAVLGSTDSTAGSGNAGAAYHYAVPNAALTTSLSGVVNFHEGAVAIAQFFTDLNAGTVNPAIIVTPGTGAGNDLSGTEGTALATGAVNIANFVNSGGGLMGHGSGNTAWGWLTTLLPGIAFPSGCSGFTLTLTAAGIAAFPGLTNADIRAGPCHNQFTGNLGGLLVLALDSSARKIILGGAAVSLPGSIDLDPPTDTNFLGEQHTVTATVRDSQLVLIVGATVDFLVLSGPNAGDSGSDTSDANGQATFTYTGDGGAGADIIEASFTDDTQTLRSTTAEKIWEQRPSGDTTPPRCDVIGIVGGNLHVEVQDTGDGLKAINVLVNDNATVNVPAFTVGTTSTVTVVGTKIDPNAPARVMIEAFDNSQAMNRSECDPILVSLSSESGSRVARETITSVPSADRYVTFYNSDSSPTFLLVTVNNKWFTVLASAETIDVGSAMVEGSDNTITLWGWGANGSVMVSDVVPLQQSSGPAWTPTRWQGYSWHPW